MRTGSGTKGTGHYDWAMLEVTSDDTPGGHDGGHSVLLARRHRYTGTLSYYRCWTPGPVPLTRLIAIAVTRWRIETCFDELETSLRGGDDVVLRSKSPPMMIYAMLCCYQAIRTLISHAADDAGIDPLRVSFTAARQAISSRISGSGCFSPRLLDELAAGLAAEITWHRHLVPRRPGRRYEHKTKRPGGRYKTRKHGEATRLRPLTKVVFWLMPIPT
jgi:hypothetical protein